MKELEQMKLLRESIMRIEEGTFNPAPGDSVQVKNSEAFAKWFTAGDQDEYEYWMRKLVRENEFLVVGDAGVGEITVDHNGDEFEAPVELFEPYTGNSQEIDADNRGMYKGMPGR